MRPRHIVKLARNELKAFHDASRVSGRRDGLASRARHHLDIESVNPERIALLEDRIGDLERRLVEREAGRTAEMAEVDAAIQRLSAQLGDAAASALTMDSVASVRLMQIERSVDHAAGVQQIGVFTDWLARAKPASLKVSVILATRNRAELLVDAVESVRNQDHKNWELVIVDDRSDDGTPALIEGLGAEDGRIVGVRLERGGLSVARNAGLARATGEIVCYLDDDNTMEPRWLSAVAWAFEQPRELDVLYGARLVEPDCREFGAAGLPQIHFERYDRRRLEEGNFVDSGTLAHRRGLPEAYFDEQIEALVDWDLVLRLTENREPMALPAVACTYKLGAAGRISQSSGKSEAWTRVQAKLQRGRPLRILAYNSLFLLVPETYIDDEMKALTNCGATLAWYTDMWSPSPVGVSEPLYTDIDLAISSFAPDMLFLFWATLGEDKFEELDRIGLPFALRVHSFDFDIERVERVRNHRLCIGVWAYPHHARLVPGTHELVPLVATFTDFPPPAPSRPVVLSASAGVPKKDWPTLVSAFARLAEKGADCRIVVGVTYALENEPGRIREAIRESGAPIKLSIDVPHDQVVDLLARTAVVVYTKVPGGPFGMPRSIIDGMCAATSVILPDRPESPLVAGPECRRYRTADDIVRHATEILAGGPRIYAERRANRRYALEHYAHPALASTFMAQITRALHDWRLRASDR